MCGAVLSGWLASSIDLVWLSVVVYVIAAVGAVAGWSMITFRDSSN
jgi:hypothetical protein